MGSHYVVTCTQILFLNPKKAENFLLPFTDYSHAIFPIFIIFSYIPLNGSSMPLSFWDKLGLLWIKSNHILTSGRVKIFKGKYIVCFIGFQNTWQHSYTLKVYRNSGKISDDKMMATDK